MSLCLPDCTVETEAGSDEEPESLSSGSYISDGDTYLCCNHINTKEYCGELNTDADRPGCMITCM